MLLLTYSFLHQDETDNQSDFETDQQYEIEQRGMLENI